MLRASTSRSVAVGGMQVWQHFLVLGDCVQSLRARAEGWGGSAADMKVKGESCLPTPPWGEPSGRWKSLGLPQSSRCL